MVGTPRLLAAVALTAVLAPAAEASVILAPGSLWSYTFADPTSDPTWATTGGSFLGPSAAPFGNCIAPIGCSGYTHDFDVTSPTSVWLADGSDGDDLWVKTTFDLTGYVLGSVGWNLGVDNGFKLYINGNLVSAANGEGYTSRWEYGGAVSPLFLNEGVNYVAVALEDHGGLTAFDMQLTASAVPEPSSLLLLGLGLGLLGVRRNRR